MSGAELLRLFTDAAKSRQAARAKQPRSAAKAKSADSAGKQEPPAKPVKDNKPRPKQARQSLAPYEERRERRLEAAVRRYWFKKRNRYGALTLPGKLGLAEVELGIFRTSRDYPMPEDYARPKRRADCRPGGWFRPNGEPCPLVSCPHHLYLEVSRQTGHIKLHYPDREVWELKETCCLDVAERGAVANNPWHGSGNTLEKVGDVLNVTRERIRQIEVRAFLKLKFDGDFDGSRELAKLLGEPLEPNWRTLERIRRRRLPLLPNGDGEAAVRALLPGYVDPADDSSLAEEDESGEDEQDD